MDQRPEQPPEGKLIEDAADNLDISIREAARRAGLSYGRWRQIVKGYQNVSPGVYAPVRNAPAKTVARMAAVTGVTPEQMETDGQRPDVAEAMRRNAEARVTPPSLAAVPPPPASLEPGPGDIFPDTEAEMRPLIDAHLQTLRHLYRLAAIRGPVASGAAIFTGTPHEAERWDRLVATGYMEKPGEGYTVPELLFLMATGRVYDDEYRAQAGKPDRRKALIRVT
jgi:hypothetical protein